MLNLLTGIHVQLWLGVSWLTHCSARCWMRNDISEKGSNLSMGLRVHAAPAKQIHWVIFRARGAWMCTIRMRCALLPCERRGPNTPLSSRLRNSCPSDLSDPCQTWPRWSETDWAELRAPGQHFRSCWLKRKPVKGGYPPGWCLEAVGIETTAKTKLLEQYPIWCYSELKWLIYFVVLQRLQPPSRCSNDPLLRASQQTRFFNPVFFFLLLCCRCLISVCKEAGWS